MKNNKVLIEKFKGFDIYYDKEKERFVADKPKLNIHFETRMLYEMKGNIQESRTEEVDKFFYIKSGYFGKRIAKIHLLTINKDTKRCSYKVIEDTEDSYDVEKFFKDENIKTYDINKHNIEIYNKVKEFEEEINKLKDKQKEYVNKLE